MQFFVIKPSPRTALSLPDCGAQYICPVDMAGYTIDARENTQTTILNMIHVQCVDTRLVCEYLKTKLKKTHIATVQKSMRMYGRSGKLIA